MAHIIENQTGAVSVDKFALAVGAGMNAINGVVSARNKWAECWDLSGDQLFPVIREIAKQCELLGAEALNAFKQALKRANTDGTWRWHPAFGEFGGTVSLALTYDKQKNPVGVNWDKGASGLNLVRYTAENAIDEAKKLAKETRETAKALVQKFDDSEETSRRALAAAAETAERLKAATSNLATLEAENAALRAKVAQLETENAELRAKARRRA